MSKFKIGDKVKIPTRKSKGREIEEFNLELENSNYALDYLIVSSSCDWCVRINFDSELKLGNDIFIESDLEPYEEEMTIHLPIELLELAEPNNAKSNNEEEIIKKLFQTSKCDIWKRLIFAYADENDYNAVKEIAALADKLK